MRTRTVWGWTGLAAVLLLGTSAHAFFLDKGRNFDVRLRAYSQFVILTEKPYDAEPWPDYSAGDIASQRNFYNPEFDAKLTDYTRWMENVPGLSFLKPDDFKFRFAWWGFYDGIYDYVDPQWNDARRGVPIPELVRQTKAVLTPAQRAAAAQLKGINSVYASQARLSQSDNPRRESFAFNDENKNVRHILATRNRINELYFDYTRGRFFTRIGRQAISWGESDSIALLDVSNPFDLTYGASGFHLDTDEARIPLWTARTTVKLIDSWQWMSSVFADAYLVPGPIDTTTSINPTWFGQPFSPPGFDPMQGTIRPAYLGSLPAHIVVVDRLRPKTWDETRWGIRLTGVIARDYTVQTWFFRTYPTAPTPLLIGGALARAFQPEETVLANTGYARNGFYVDNRGFRVSKCIGTGLSARTPAGRYCKKAAPIVTLLERRLEDVIGFAASWFSQPLNGIIRTEAEWFRHEDAFIPDQNLNAVVQAPFLDPNGVLGPKKAPPPNHVPKADYLRYTVGYDRFFFIRALNPSNSFTLSAAWNGSINITADDEHDFRNPQTKPGKPNACIGKGDPVPSCKFPGDKVPNNFFEDQKKFEGFLQVALLTDYMHGRLSPRLVAILDPSGIFGFQAALTYRITDNFLFQPSLLAIAGSRRTGLASFRDKDQFQVRLTYLVN